MKLLIIALALIPSIAMAQDSCEVTKQDVNTPVPLELKDAQIIVRTRDGKETVVNANEYKVVKRHQQFKVKETVVAAPPCKAEVVIVDNTKPTRKNLVMLGVAYDYNSLTSDKSMDGTTTVARTYSHKGPVFDLSYYRREILAERFGLGLGLNTNLAPRAFVGYEF